MKVEDIYSEEITTHSFQELANFIKWMNKIYGNYPMIIGGWAVYAYEPTRGSRDIDIVFESAKIMGKILIDYYKNNGYIFRKKDICTIEYYKIIPTEEGNVEINIDACSVSNVNFLKEDREIKIPWPLCFKNYCEKKINDVKFLVPSLEILLILKVKALRDREYELKTSLFLSEGDKEFLKSKIIKDKHDIEVLMQLDIDEKFLNKILEEYKFTKYFNLSIKNFSTQ